MVVAFCNFTHGPQSVYQVSLNYLQYFNRYVTDKCFTDGRMYMKLLNHKTKKLNFVFSSK